MSSRRKVALACSVCGQRNYTITEKPNRTQRLEVMKFCKRCGKHTLHRETKQNNSCGQEEKLMKFLKSVIQTMKDTTWENGHELLRDTTTVIVMSAFFAVFFAIVDFVVQWGLGKII